MLCRDRCDNCLVGWTRCCCKSFLGNEPAESCFRFNNKIQFLLRSGRWKTPRLFCIANFSFLSSWEMEGNLGNQGRGQIWVRKRAVECLHGSEPRCMHAAKSSYKSAIITGLPLRFSLLVYARTRCRKPIAQGSSQISVLISDLMRSFTVTAVILLISQEVWVDAFLLIKAVFTQDFCLETLQVGSCKQQARCFIVQYNPCCTNLLTREKGKQVMKVFLVQIVIFGVSPPSCYISWAVWKHHNITDSKTVCTFNILRSLPTVVVKMRSKSCPDGSFAISLVKTRTICCSYSLLILHFCFVLRLIWEVQSYFLLTALTGVLFALDIPSFFDCQFFTPSDQLYSETVGCVCVWGGGWGGVYV